MDKAIAPAAPAAQPPDRLNRLDALGYAGFHLACLGVLAVPPTTADLVVGAVLFCVASFGISVGWHRHLSHRAFETSRVFRLFLVLCGAISGMKGALWFAQHHRHHHRASDRADDDHSPLAQGFAYSHFLWFLTDRHRNTDLTRVAHWARDPALVRVNDLTWLVGLAVALSILAVLGWSGLFWAYLLPTVLVWHTFKAVGSLCHSGFAGYRRFATPDNSFNNPVIGLLGFGDGWHNNHHHMPYSARIGVAWWEPDPGWCLIWVFERLGLVWDVRRPRPGDADPQAALGGRRAARVLHWLRQLREAIGAVLSDCALDPGTKTRLDARLEAFSTAAAGAVLSRPLRLAGLLAGLRRDLKALLSATPVLAVRVDRLVVERAAASPLAHLWFAPRRGRPEI